MRNRIKGRILDSAVVEMDRDITKQMFYYMLHTTDDLDIDLFEQSVNKVADTLPILRSVFRLGFWRDYWELPQNGMEQDIVFITDVQGENFHERAEELFTRSKDRVVYPEIMPPLKCMIWHHKAGEGNFIVFVMSHALGDPGCGTEIIHCIAKQYEALRQGKEYTFKNANRGMGYLFHTLGFRNVISAITQQFRKSKEEQIFEEICPLNYDKTEEGHVRLFDFLVMPKQEVKIFREKYKQYKFTVNDMLIIMIARLIKKYNEEINVKSTHIYLSIGVGYRGMLKDGIITITNFAGRDEIIIPFEKADDLNYLSMRLKEFKSMTRGIHFLFPFAALAGFPIKVQKSFWRKATKDNLIGWSNKTFSTTNIGSLDSYVKEFGETIMSFRFLASFAYAGLPLVSASGFRGDLCIYLSRNTDPDGWIQKVKIDIQNEWKRLLNE